MGLVRWLRSVIGRPKGLSRRGRDILQEGARQVREWDGSPEALRAISAWWETALQELPEEEADLLRLLARQRARFHQAAGEHWVTVAHRRLVEDVIRDTGGRP